MRRRAIAVAVFAGGSRPVVGAVKTNKAPGVTSAAPTGVTPTGVAPTPSQEAVKTPSLSPSASRTIIFPQLTLGGDSTPPNPADAIKVVASGTVDGQSWRLVRDVFVVPNAGAIDPAVGQHLPLSRSGSAGTFTCDSTNLQWGSRPAGTQPDFGTGGSCGRGAEDVTGELSWGVVSTPGPGPVLWALIGRVGNAKAVASVSLTIGDHTTPHQAVVPVAGEQDGYYVIFVPALSDQDEKLPKSITSYDADGHSVGLQNMG